MMNKWRFNPQKVRERLAYVFAICLLSAIPMSLFAQVFKLTMNKQNVTIESVLREVEKRSQYTLFYNDNQVKLNKKISVNLKDASLDETLRQVFNGTGYSYRVVNNQIIISSATSHTSSINQQGKRVEISGTVKDEKGDAIIGASVIERGSAKNGVITDMDGHFSLMVTPGNELQISFVGYKPQVVRTRAGVSSYAIVMKEEATSLNEVVVVGYGVQRKVNLTGSVSQLDSKTLENRPIQNISNGIQGMMPSVTITDTNGAPGMDGGSIRVRGVGTLNNASPYILVDGVETGTLNSIDPNDIATISVLKDAASAAIYGSKASNGVILITTKRGNTGTPQIQYSGYVSAQDATHLIDRLSSADYATLYNKALVAEGKSARFTDAEITKFRDGSDPYKYPNTDWYGLAYKTGLQHRHNVNVTGGSDFVRYMASVGYMYQTGILPNAKREQFNARTNLDMKLSKRLTGHLNLAFIRNNYADPSSAYAGGSSDQIIRQLNLIAPWIVNKNEDGTYGTISDGNPMAWLDSGMKVERKNNNFTGMMGLDYQIMDGLKLSVQGSYIDNYQHYLYFQKLIQYNPNKASEPNHLDDNQYKWDRTNYDATLNYDKQFGVHGIKFMAGWHTEKYNYSQTTSYRKNFPNNELTDMNAGDASTQTNGGYSRELSMVSYFGRLNYDYAGKYLFEANFRADASSRFAKGNRWGYFPSFSAGWRVSEESFMQSTKDWLTNLKIRASWGQLGNQDALSDYYPWMNTYNLGAKYPFDGSLNTGYYQSNYHLSTISWEKATTWGIGADFTLFNKLTASVDYYNRKTTGIIMDVAVPAEFALSAYKDNVGSMRNQGVEVSLNYNTKIGEDWTLDVTGNFAYNKNKVLDLGGAEYIDNGNNRHAIGKAFNSFYMYKADGFFNSDDEATAYTTKYGNPFGKKFKAGDLKYVDTNEDGKLTSADKVYMKNTDNPKFTFSFNIGATYKAFDLSMVWQGVTGVSHIYNNEVYGDFYGDSSHPSTIWLNAWTTDNTNAKMPRIALQRNSPSHPTVAMSDFWLQNASYLRLKNIQIGYTLPRALVQKIGLTKVRIYYSGENLLTIDHMKVNLDPEATSARASSYPLLRTNAFGVNVTF